MYLFLLQGFRAARAGLLTNTYLLAQTVTLDKRSYQALAITDEQRSVIEVSPHFRLEQHPALGAFTCCETSAIGVERMKRC